MVSTINFTVNYQDTERSTGMLGTNESNLSRLAIPQQCEEGAESLHPRMPWSFWRERFNKRQQLETRGMLL